MMKSPSKRYGSGAQIGMDSYYYSGPLTDLANTASLPRRAIGIPCPTLTTPPCEEPMWRLELPTTMRTTKAYADYVEGSHTPGPADGALDRAAEMLAKPLSGSEDPEVTPLSEAVRAKLGISEPLTRKVEQAFTIDAVDDIVLFSAAACSWCFLMLYLCIPLMMINLAKYNSFPSPNPQPQ